MAGEVLEISFTGAKEFAMMLERLEKKTVEKISKTICKDSLQPMLAVAKLSAQSLGSGDMSSAIAENLKIYVIKKSSMRPGHYGASVRFKQNGSELVSYSMGSSSNLKTKKTSGKRYFIPNAIEYGHAFPGRGGRKNSPKDVAARPFMRPAFDQTKNTCAELAEELVLEFVDSQENNE